MLECSSTSIIQVYTGRWENAKGCSTGTRHLKLLVALLLPSHCLVIHAKLVPWYKPGSPGPKCPACSSSTNTHPTNGYSSRVDRIEEKLILSSPMELLLLVALDFRSGEGRFLTPP